LAERLKLSTLTIRRLLSDDPDVKPALICSDCHNEMYKTKQEVGALAGATPIKRMTNEQGEMQQKLIAELAKCLNDGAPLEGFIQARQDLVVSFPVDERLSVAQVITDMTLDLTIQAMQEIREQKEEI
jgi:hypothetical protein